MAQLSQLKFAQPRLLLPGMAVALLPVGGVLADEVPEAAAGPAYEEVLVTGQNLSIQSSIEAKKTADVTIDVISADNLGKIPDATVADSLAHIPGRSISGIELLRPVLRRFFVTGCVMFQAPERSASDAVAACRSKRKHGESSATVRGLSQAGTRAAKGSRPTRCRSRCCWKRSNVRCLVKNCYVRSDSNLEVRCQFGLS